jgi:hypothetical protein
MTNKQKTSRSQASEDKIRLIHVSINEHRIVVFKFDKLTRTAFEEYLAYVRKYSGQYPDPLRVLYDFRGAGLPGLPFMELHTQAMDGLDIPDRMRYAHIVDRRIFRQFVKKLMSRLPDMAYEHQTFIDEDKAIEWLMRPFE